jgi:hypothetical protein
MKMFLRMVFLLVVVFGGVVYGDEHAVTFLGVQTRPVDDVLGSQLDLGRGMGLVVVWVADDSPAGKVLQKNDVLVKLGDQVLVNMEQLEVLVRSRKPGDEVVLEFVRKAKHFSEKVVLGECESERAMPPFMPFRLHPHPHPRWDLMLGDDCCDGDDCCHGEDCCDGDDCDCGAPEGARGDAGKLRENSKRKVFRSMRIRKVGDEPIETKSTFLATIMDKNGVSYTLSHTGDKVKVMIREPEGRLVFNGPYNTDADKEKIPEKYRKKVKELVAMDNK